MSEFENHVFDVWNRFVRNMPCCPEDGCDRWCDGENILCKTYEDAQRSLIILMKRLDEQYLLPVFMIQKKIREWDV